MGLSVAEAVKAWCMRRTRSDETLRFLLLARVDFLDAVFAAGFFAAGLEADLDVFAAEADFFAEEDAAVDSEVAADCGVAAAPGDEGPANISASERSPTANRD